MKSIKKTDIKREWHRLDAKNQVLGRLATSIANILMGKNKAYYTPNLDCGDFVVVINSANIIFTGKKENQKSYYHYSGYPGGLKTRTVAQIRSQKPQEIIRHAVVGMLPKNKLGKTMVKKLYIYEGSDHPYSHKFKN